MNLFDLRGKKALITGSTQGIGLSIAKVLYENGAEVWVNGATSEEKCRLAATSIGEGARYICLDLSADDVADRMYDATGDIDILVNCASIQIRKAWNEVTIEEFTLQMNTNFRAVLLLSQIYYPYMKKQGWGRILCVGSVQQYKPNKDMIVYAASKEAQMNMVKNLAKQMAPYGITVNNLSPGVILTPRNEKVLSDPIYAHKVIQEIPMGFAGMPEDCAGAALLLCSDAGRYISGTDLSVDGGMKL